MINHRPELTSHFTRFIQWGLLVLVALMPFHAFLSVSLGHIFGHQAVIQAWKEVLLVLLSGLGLWLALKDPAARTRLRSLPVILAGAFALVAALVTIITQPPVTAVLFGAKTDLEFLAAFALAVMVSTPVFLKRLALIILISASIVVSFGLLQATILPHDFLVRFGYGPNTIPPYLSLDPVLESVRFGSTLGGPNQLGTYLILPLALTAVRVVRRRQWAWLLLVLAGSIVAFNTHSRSAWLGLLVAASIMLVLLIPHRFRLLATGAILALGAGAAALINYLLKQGGNLQYYILHSNVTWHGARGSDFEHLNSLRNGVDLVLTNPLGHGLGTAGPATFRAAGGPGLIIENNFLQIAYETGLIGALVFVGFIVVCGRELLRRSRTSDLAAASFAAIAGVCVAALVLPAWTDSTTALVIWTAAGSVIGLKPSEAHDV